MLVRQAFRYRLYPSSEQRHQLAVQFGHARHAYNWALARRQEHYRETGAALSFYDLKRAVTALKSEPDHLWLKEADSQVLQAKVADLEKSYKGFFTHRTDFPRFKTTKDRQSIRYPQRFRFKDNRIYLPKVGWVRAAFHREMVGTPKNVTVSKMAAGKYYASVQCERELDIPVHTGPAVGVDVGLKDLAALSTGEKVPHRPHTCGKRRSGWPGCNAPPRARSRGARTARRRASWSPANTSTSPTAAATPSTNSAIVSRAISASYGWRI